MQLDYLIYAVVTQLIGDRKRIKSVKTQPSLGKTQTRRLVK